MDIGRRVHFSDSDTFIENQNDQDQKDQYQKDQYQNETDNQNETGDQNETDGENDMNNSERASDVLSKAGLIQINRGWNDKNERMIISIGENAASYKWMHERSSGYHKVINNTTNLVLIVLSAILSADTIVPNICQSGDSVIYILRLTIVYLITFTSIVQNFSKSQEMSEKHSAAALQFSQLYHNIQQQMCRFRRDRAIASTYVSDCLKRYDSLVINNPDINGFILWRFKNTFRNTDIAFPDIADRIQKIEIITESSPPTHSSKNINVNAQQVYQKDNELNRTSIDTHNENMSIRNCNNLNTIYNAFQIHGDISDRDLQNINSVELRELRNQFLKQKLDYEYQRFLQHNTEYD